MNTSKLASPNDDDKSECLSAQKVKSNFQFKEVLSAGLQKNIFDNYHIFKKFFDVSMRKCSRQYMEDRFCVYQQPKNSTLKETFFGVFDGHKTHDISTMLKNKLYQQIQSQKSYESNINESIFLATQILDEEIQDHIKIRNIKGGSTALCALIRNKVIHLFNVGDSICALVTKHGIKQINQQHRPCNHKEQENLVKRGALLLERNGITRINGELALSRSFGDNDHKEYITAIPDIYTFDIGQNDKYLILATDGYWDVFTLEETEELVKLWEEEEKGESNNIENLSLYLIGEANTKITNFKKDNMTVLAIDLQYILEDNPMANSKMIFD